MSFAKKFGSKYDKKSINKGTSASKKIKPAATNLIKVNMVKC